MVISYSRVTRLKRLPAAVKRRIVEHLAGFRRHAETARFIEEEFGISINPRHVRAYDPTANQCATGGEWASYFWIMRERFEKQASAIPITQQVYRLKCLDHMLAKALERGNLVQAARFLEQAAKETGGWYGNGD